MAGDKKKILIVDDDEAMAKAIKRTLSLENKYDLKVAYDGLEAVQYFMEGKPDLVILDLRMPRVDGYKLCTAIRNDPDNKGVKILVVSAVINAANQGEIKKMGVEDTLQKPFDNNVLRAKVEQLIG